MKKIFALLLVLVLGVTLLAVVGCGGDTDQAKEYIKEADAAYEAVNKKMEALSETLATTVGGAMSGNFSAITPETMSATAATIDEVLKELPEVAKLYEKVEDLEGVEDYQNYADAMVKTISAQEAAVLNGKNLLEAIAPLAASGDQAALAAWFQANSAELMKAQELSTIADEQYAKAREMKKDLDLE
jgi:hypothetical protein